MEKIIVRVPSTCSDIVMGSDAFGLTLQTFCTVIVEEETDHWRVNHALGEGIPHNEDNLIVQAILHVNPTVHPHQLTVMSDIPINEQVGARTSMIIAGIKIANCLCKMNLSLDEQINLGRQLGESLSKVTAAILGGLTVSSFQNDQVTAIQAKIPDISALLVMDNGFNSNDYKKPKRINIEDELKVSSIAGVFTAAIMDNEWSKATMVIENSPFFKYYSKRCINKLNWVKNNAHSLGIYGTFMLTNSTVITLGEASYLNKLRDYLINDEGNKYQIKIFPVCETGATIHGE